MFALGVLRFLLALVAYAIPFKFATRLASLVQFSFSTNPFIPAASVFELEQITFNVKGVIICLFRSHVEL